MKDHIGQDLNLGDFFRVQTYNMTIIGVITKKSEQKNLIHCYCCERDELGALDVYRALLHSTDVIRIDISSDMPQDI